MKRICLCMILLLSLCLAGCGSRAEEKRLEEFSAALNAGDDLGFVGKLRCEYPDRSVSFTLQYRQNEAGCEISVLQPEELENLKVSLDENGSVLHYDELFLDTGELDRFGLSPLSALPLLTESLRGAYLDSVRREGDFTVYSLVPADDVQVDVSFDDEMKPVKAELISEGKVRVFCDIESWR